MITIMASPVIAYQVIFAVCNVPLRSELGSLNNVRKLYIISVSRDPCLPRVSGHGVGLKFQICLTMVGSAK